MPPVVPHRCRTPPRNPPLSPGGAPDTEVRSQCLGRSSMRIISTWHRQTGHRPPDHPCCYKPPPAPCQRGVSPTSLASVYSIPAPRHLLLPPAQPRRQPGCASSPDRAVPSSSDLTLRVGHAQLVGLDLVCPTRADEPSAEDATKIAWLRKTDAAEEVLEPGLPIIDVREPWARLEPCPPPHPPPPLFAAVVAAAPPHAGRSIRLNIPVATPTAAPSPVGCASTTLGRHAPHH